MSRRLGAALFALLAFACGGSPGQASPDPDPPDPDSPNPVYSVAFRYSGVVEVNSQLRRIELRDNVGSATFSDGTLPAVAAQSVDWVDQGFRLIHVFAVDESDIRVTFVYCRDGMTSGGYFESLLSALSLYADLESQPCSVSQVSHDVDPRVLRPFVAAPHGLVPSTRAKVSGSSGIALGADGSGHLVLANEDWSLTAFGFLDCEATVCGAPGWYEVHALLQRPGGSTGFVVLYLLRDDLQHVRTGYGIRLDELSNLPDTSFAAAWEVL